MLCSCRIAQLSETLCTLPVFAVPVRVLCAYYIIIIGASLSEPLLDELAGAFLWYIYIYIFVSIMGSPFGPA